MARITVEDCLDRVNNRFALIHMASKRVRQLRKGSEPTVSAKNRDVVIALREIAAGNVEMIQGGGADKPDDYDDNFTSSEETASGIE
jgi:DNA-directed RNA polymerase subunit omega